MACTTYKYGDLGDGLFYHVLPTLLVYIVFFLNIYYIGFTNIIYLPGWWFQQILFCPFSWECHHPN